MNGLATIRVYFGLLSDYFTMSRAYFTTFIGNLGTLRACLGSFAGIIKPGTLRVCI